MHMTHVLDKALCIPQKRGDRLSSVLHTMYRPFLAATKTDLHTAQRRSPQTAPILARAPDKTNR